VNQLAPQIGLPVTPGCLAGGCLAVLKLEVISRPSQSGGRIDAFLLQLVSRSADGLDDLTSSAEFRSAKQECAQFQTVGFKHVYEFGGYGLLANIPRRAEEVIDGDLSST
jgi:hypothetical protein